MKPTRTKFAKRNRDTILPSKLAHLINDVVAILLFALSLIIALALATHSTDDGCWSKSVDTLVISNKLGVVGAYLSDVLLYLLGFSCWWLVIGLFYLGFVKINRNKFIPGTWSNIYRTLSYFLLLAASATFEYITFYHQKLLLPDGPGGSVGGFLFALSYHGVGEVGVAVGSLLLMITCFSFAFSVSWLKVSEKIGATIEFTLAQLSQLVARQERLVTAELATSTEDIFLDSLTRSSATLARSGTTPACTGTTPAFFAEPAHELVAADGSLETFNFDFDDEMLSCSNSTANLLTPEIADEFIDLAPIVVKPRFKGPFAQALAAIPSVVVSPPRVKLAPGSLPSTNLLNLPRVQIEGVPPETIDYVCNTIESTLAEFGVEVSISNVESGPVITRYELVPPKGVRGDKIASLAKEIARSLALPSIRIVEIIPGKNSMGIEVPNFKRQTIYLKEIFDSAVYKNNNSLLTLALGRDIAGDVIVMDLAKMPHLLVAGTTGSGKSVAINAMILSILFNASPEEVKFIMIDPKMVELSFYQDIPHLLAPVVTDMSQAANALKWTVGEMEQRYKIMAKIGTKNIVGFNQKVESMAQQGTPLFNPYSPDPKEPEELTKWPYIVVIIDELADLMMVAGKKIEQYIARIAQKARAVGIHLIVATQRPSVDVITGLIKANIPARISFQVSSKIDSRTILDQMGAESLLGQGDMLFLNPGSGFPRRIHGAYVNDDELHSVVEYLKQQGAPNYNEEILSGSNDVAIPGFEDETNSDANSVEKDSVFDEAVKFIIDTRRCSISSLQTQFGIGYNKAARIMNHLEKIGMVRRTDRGGFEILQQATQ